MKIQNIVLESHNKMLFILFCSKCNIKNIRTDVVVMNIKCVLHKILLTSKDVIQIFH